MTQEEKKARELVNKFSIFTEYEECSVECAKACVREQVDLLNDMIQIDYRIRDVFILELLNTLEQLEKL